MQKSKRACKAVEREDRQEIEKGIAHLGGW
jgi:hypothetical protein